MKEITSRANPSVKRAVKLRSGRGRDEYNAFLAEGDILIEEAIGNGADIAEIFVREGADCEETDFGGITAGTDRINSLSSDLFDEIADTVTPHDVIAIINKPEYGMLSGDLLNGLADVHIVDADMEHTDAGQVALSIIILDRVQDPGNVGTILRSADAAGFDAVIAVKGTADVYAPKVVRAAAGAIFRIPVFRAQDADEALAALRDANFKVCALHMHSADYCEAELQGRTALVVGNEGAGVSKDFLLGAQMRVAIPMREGADSLNAGVAASIVMFEKVRQDRKYKK